MANSKVKIRPLGSRVLIKPLNEEEVSQGGLIIPDTAEKEKPQQGEIIAVGRKLNDDGKELPFDVNVGDVVLFKKYAPDEVERDGEEYLVVDESDILAVLD
ncbi:co-chaperone GroES [Candidatus Dojkabacteria bacterium]|nr:co-chaperone GroES [Candidatus Dojkabacteria bacterium]